MRWRGRDWPPALICQAKEMKLVTCSQLALNFFNPSPTPILLSVHNGAMRNWNSVGGAAIEKRHPPEFGLFGN